jgi:hypothetical protein
MAEIPTTVAEFFRNPDSAASENLPYLRTLANIGRLAGVEWRKKISRATPKRDPAE